MISRIGSVIFFGGLAVAGVLVAESGTANKNRAVRTTPDETPQTPDSRQPASNNAIQRVAAQLEFPNGRPKQFAPSARAQPIESGDRIAEILRKYMPKASAEEREIWREQFEGMQPEEIEFVLQQRTPLTASLTGDLNFDIGAGPIANDGNVIVDNPSIHSDDAQQFDALNPTQVITTKARLLEAVKFNLTHSDQPGFKRWLIEIEPASESSGYRVDTSPASLIRTQDAFDLALLDGGSFFRILVGDREFFTRNGSFHRAGNTLVTEYLIDGQKGVLLSNLPEKLESFHVSEDGTLQVNGQQQEDPIPVRRFLNPGRLSRTSQPFVFVANEESGPPLVTEPSLAQGAIEQSNSHDGSRERALLNQLREQEELLNELSNSRGD